MSERFVPTAELDGYVGQNISAICTTGFTNEAHGTNHCAHFVAHVLSLSFGATCGRHGATIRVNEIYNRCTDRGKWSDVEIPPLVQTLIFATQRTNLGHDSNMMNGPNKHMGIWNFDNAAWSGDYVYNYSTMARRVLKETVSDFLTRLEGVYNPDGTNPVQLFYGRNLP
jgi:hypothetical protein